MIILITMVIKNILVSILQHIDPDSLDLRGVQQHSMLLRHYGTHVCHLRYLKYSKKKITSSLKRFIEEMQIEPFDVTRCFKKLKLTHVTRIFKDRTWDVESLETEQTKVGRGS